MSRWTSHEKKLNKFLPKNRLSATVNIDVVLKTIKKIPDDNFFNEDTNIIADDIDTYNILKD